MRILMLGAGGHARSVADALGATAVDAVVLPHLGDEDYTAIAQQAITEADLLEMNAGDMQLVNGIGQIGAFGPRWDAYQRLREHGFEFRSVIHSTAVISPTASLGSGVQILAGSIVGPNVVLGDNTLVNTGAIVEHDCVVASGVHVGSGAVLCGAVSVGIGSMIGAGATIIPARKVGDGSQIGAGAVLVGDVGAGEVHGGVPARPLRSSR